MTAHKEYMEQLEQALAFILEGDSFLVVSHVQPDGDAISSTVAVSWLLKQLGKASVLVNESELPSRLNYLYDFDRIERYSEDKFQESFDRIIAVDCADFRRIGEVSRSFGVNSQLLNIDHHPTNNGFGAVNVIRPDAAATVEILFDLIELAKQPLDLDCATAIYTGLITDTGGFRYSNTSPRVMEIASKLLAVGVSGYWLADWLLEKMTIGKLKLLQLALKRLTFSDNLEIGWLYIDQQDMKNTGAVSEDIEGIVNYALNVDGVEVGILIKESKDGSLKASLRSAGKANVAQVAQQFGGGGHTRAAGCKLDGTIEEATAQLVEAVRKALVM